MSRDKNRGLTKKKTARISFEKYGKVLTSRDEGNKLQLYSRKWKERVKFGEYLLPLNSELLYFCPLSNNTNINTVNPCYDGLIRGHSSVALQPFDGPWPLLQFRNLFLRRR
jgi:hypothetical protein